MSAQGIQGRVVAVTGCGRGIGLAIVAELLDRGAQVIANYNRSVDRLKELADIHPGRVHLVAGDIGEESTALCIRDAAEELGRLDAVVHNAGITRDQLLVRMTIDEWDEVQRVNLRGAFLVTKHSLKLMMRRRYGRVVYLSSLAAVMGNAGQANYAASKAGLHGLSHTVAQEYGRCGIRSTVLALGIVDAGLGAELDSATRDTKLQRSLVGAGKAGEVAATVAYLVGPGADNVTANVIRMDGGVQY
jgi:3-oxoacyl-[acyl-carrier protein] reductase